MSRQKKVPPASTERDMDMDTVSADQSTRGNHSAPLKRLPRSEKFKPSADGWVIVFLGWPDKLFEDCSLVLPAGEDPCAFDWSLLKGCRALVYPGADGTAPHGLLFDIADVLLAAGVASVVLNDGQKTIAVGVQRPAVALVGGNA